MPDSSPLLALPYIQPSQAQKHVTHNESLRILDGLVQLSVESLATATPPAAPQVGIRHIVGDGASGVWAGHDAEVAVWQPDGVWLFLVPAVGWTAFVTDTGNFVAYDGTAWAAVAGPLSEQVDRLGINTGADATNRLAVAADATLLSHAGGGHQLKLNKNAETDTASLLFQTGYGGRAEMGLAGEDAFSVKVSADGVAWSTALQTDPATGAVRFPGGGVRATALSDVTYHVDPVLGSDTGEGTAPGSGAFATLEHAVAVARRRDADGFATTIQLADGTHTLAAAIAIDHPLPGTREIVVRGNPADKTAVSISGPDHLFRLESCRMRLSHCSVSSSGAESFLFVVHHGAQIVLDTVAFGTSGKGHIDIEDGSVYVHGDCTITGGVQFHARLELSARLSINQADYTLIGTPDFSGMFLKCGEASMARVRDSSFTGAATGQRYYVYENAMITTGNMGETFLPGNADGVAVLGGRYR